MTAPHQHDPIPPLALLLMVVSALSFALSSFFALYAMQHASTSLAVLVRFAFPLVLLSVVYQYYGYWKEVNLAELKEIFWRVAALSLSQACLFIAVAHMTLDEATILYSTSPIFMTIWSAIKTRSIPVRGFVAVLLGAVGVAVMMHFEHAKPNPYYVIGVAAGLFQAVSQLMLHKATQKRRNLYVMYDTYLGCTLFCLLFLLVQPPTLDLAQPTAAVLVTIAFLCLSGIGSLGNQYCRSWAYSLVKDAAPISPLIYLCVLFATLLDFMFLHDLPDAETVIGGVTIITGAILASRPAKVPLPAVEGPTPRPESRTS